MGLSDVGAPKFCLDNRLTDGNEVVSLTGPAAICTPGRFLVLISVKRLSRPQGHSEAERIVN
jgi:hypothetical protein